MNLDGLLDLARGARALPEMPEHAFRLVSELSKPEPSAIKVERLILCDPALTAQVFRYAGSSAFGLPEGSVRTVSGAVAVLGYVTLQGLAAMAMLHSTFVGRELRPPFECWRFAAHGAFCGFFSRYLLSAALTNDAAPCELTPDEAFGAMVLCDLSSGILALVAPELNAELAREAGASGEALDEVFQRHYEVPLALLGLETARAWCLPEVLLSPVRHRAGEQPGSETLAALLDAVEGTAQANGFGIYPWSTGLLDLSESLRVLRVDEEHVEPMVALVKSHVANYVRVPMAA